MLLCYNILLSNFRSITCHVLAYGRLRKKIQTLALKVVVVNCERWSLKRSFKYIDFPFSSLVFWKNLSLRRSGSSVVQLFNNLVNYKSFYSFFAS